MTIAEYNALGKELEEVLQTDPGRAGDTIFDGELTESDLDAVHGQVSENDNVCQRHCDHKMQLPVSFKVM